MKREPVVIFEGDVFGSMKQVPMSKTRRVVGVSGDVVCYSTGGDHNRYCKRKTFESFVRKAALVHPSSRRE